MLEADTEKLRLLFVELYGRHCWPGVFAAKGSGSVIEREIWVISDRLKKLKSWI